MAGDGREEICYRCRYWLRLDHANGVCRRYPPDADGRSPLTDPKYWCGEFVEN